VGVAICVQGGSRVDSTQFIIQWCVFLLPYLLCIRPLDTIFEFAGEGLAIAPAPRHNWIVVVPLCLPGERIRARVYRHSRLHSVADLVSVEEPNNDLRDSSRIKCKYFGQCAGCQYQMLSYDTQLDLKRTVVVKAYRNFSGARSLFLSRLPLLSSM
jgi:tRNA/tmRNA/rRNA uracil-C5-methylase (TrmA/RlmC/RlmD family)